MTRRLLSIILLTLLVGLAVPAPAEDCIDYGDPPNR